MKTTIDIPDALLQSAKVYAAKRRTSLKALIVQGLYMATRPDQTDTAQKDALARLRVGMKLGGAPLSRHAAHDRK